MKNQDRFWLSLPVVLCLIGFPFSTVIAQETGQSEYVSSEEAAEIISIERLDALLAPIALYPDAVLAQVLMASTYPVDVIEAARWRAMNPEVEGERLQNVLDVMDWDASVKALVTVPEVLQRMNDEPRWMQELGDAVLSDQKRVTERIQYLRQQAKAMNSLASNDKQIVGERTDAETTQPYITITPASSEVIYVPYYDPVIVYGDWWWPSYPVYWRSPGVSLASGYYWGRGYRHASITLWGGFNWHNGLITISVPLYSRYYRTAPVVVGPYNAWWRPAPMYAPPYYYQGGARVAAPPSRPWYRPSPPHYTNPQHRPPQYIRPPQGDGRPSSVRPPQGNERPNVPPNVQLPGNEQPSYIRPPQESSRPQQTRPQQHVRPPQNDRPSYISPPQGNERPNVRPNVQLPGNERPSYIRPPQESSRPQPMRPPRQIRPPNTTNTPRPSYGSGQTGRANISISRPETGAAQQGGMRQRRNND